MSAQAYVGTARRTFQEALRHLLETGYGLLGSGRVLGLLGEDVQRLVEEFYPPPERLASGWMVFTATRAVGAKAHPGQTGGDHELVTVAWPVLLPEDLQALAQGPDTQARRAELVQRRLIRLIEYGWGHPQGPLVLTLADLSALTGLRTTQVSELLRAARETTGKSLPLKGYYFDQGVKPSHKAQIIALYEQGVEELEIARRSGHTPESVGHYLRNYAQVRLLRERGTPEEEMRFILQLTPSVIRAHLVLLAQYHPELGPLDETAPQP
jgi:hypothetical protein